MLSHRIMVFPVSGIPRFSSIWTDAAIIVGTTSPADTPNSAWTHETYLRKKSVERKGVRHCTHHVTRHPNAKSSYNSKARLRTPTMSHNTLIAVYRRVGYLEGAGDADVLLCHPLNAHVCPHHEQTEIGHQTCSEGTPNVRHRSTETVGAVKDKIGISERQRLRNSAPNNGRQFVLQITRTRLHDTYTLPSERHPLPSRSSHSDPHYTCTRCRKRRP